MNKKDHYEKLYNTLRKSLSHDETVECIRFMKWVEEENEEIKIALDFGILTMDKNTIH